MKNKTMNNLIGFTDICDNEAELMLVNAGCADDVYPIPKNYHIVDHFNPLTVDNYYKQKEASSAAGRDNSYACAPSQKSCNQKYQKEQGYGIYKYKR